MAWGQTAAERRAERAAGSGKFFIRSFQDPDTKIRCLWDDPFNTFVEFEEHFDRANKISYPCAIFVKYERCVGCEFPLPDNHDPEKMLKADGKQKREGCGCAGCQVRKRNSQWLFPALNDEGFLNVYKIGYKLWMDLRGKYELFGTITNLDYAILHQIDESKSGPSAHSYTAVPIPGTDHPREQKTRTPSLGQLLMNKYAEALAKYQVDPASVGFDPSAAADQEPEPLPEGTEATPEQHASADVAPDEDEGDTDVPVALRSITEIRAELAKLGVPVSEAVPDETVRQLYDGILAAQAPSAPPDEAQATPTEQAAAAAPAATPAPTPAPAPASNGAVSNGNGNGAAGRDFSTWTTQDVRDFLKEDPAMDFSATAPRSQLLKLAEAKESALARA